MARSNVSNFSLRKCACIEYLHCQTVLDISFSTTHSKIPLEIMNTHHKIAFLCQTIKLLIGISLLVIAIFLSNEVWNQFASKATSFKESEMEITESESPAIIIGFWPLKNMDHPSGVPYQSYEQWILGKDFDLTFGVIEYQTVKEMLVFNQTHTSSNISHGSIGKVVLTTLMSKYGNFFKISANIINIKAPFNAFVNVKFNDSIQEESLPDIEIYLTSEPNSFGVTMDDFVDGAVQIYGSVKGYNIVRIQPSKVFKLESKEKCQESSFYQCFESELFGQNYSQCPRKCAPISTPSNIMPLCESVEEFKCALEIVKRLQNDDSLHKCRSSCNVIDFHPRGKYTEEQNERKNVTFLYRIKEKMLKLEEEYLIQDFVGMLSSVGGTLGMFVGFSFVGLSSSIFDHLQRMLEKLMDKKSLSEVGNMPKGLIKVQNIKDEAAMEDRITLAERIQGLETELSIINSKIQNMK